jgi:hypothetical protein
MWRIKGGKSQDIAIATKLCGEKMYLRQRRVCSRLTAWWITTGQRPKAVKSLMAQSRGFPGNRRKSDQASRLAVGRQPVHQKRHAEIGCAGHKWCKQRSLKLYELAARRDPSFTSFSERSKWSNLLLDDERSRRRRQSCAVMKAVNEFLVNFW